METHNSNSFCYTEDLEITSGDLYDLTITVDITVLYLNLHISGFRWDLFQVYDTDLSAFGQSDATDEPLNWTIFHFKASRRCWHTDKHLRFQSGQEEREAGVDNIRRLKCLLSFSHVYFNSISYTSLGPMYDIWRG